MTAETTIAIAHNIAHNHSPELFPSFAKNWRLFLESDLDPVLKDCAHLILDALESMDKKSGTGSRLSAARRISEGASRENMRGVWIDSDGRSCICDGYRAVRLFERFESIPTIEPWDGLQKVFADPCRYSRVIDAPTVSQVKQAASLYRAAHGKKSIPLYDFGEGLPRVNASYLIDMLTLIPGAKLYIADNRVEISPIYFVSEKGDGILLPVRKR